jgi:Asp/Glu/hydantoin racemase
MLQSEESQVMNCSVAKISVKRVCHSLKSHGKTLLEVSGGEENEEETSVRKVEKGVREQSGNSKEIVKRKGFDVFGEI